MKIILTAATIGAFVLASASPVLALDLNNKTATQSEISTEETGSIKHVTLVPGENSFTESQAKQRIEKAGFTNVGTLIMDDQGIWRGTASKGAMTVHVGLDFKGNVAAGDKITQ